MNLIKAALRPRRTFAVARSRALAWAIRRAPGFQNVDIVDFDDVCCFMFTDDNLHAHYVPAGRKSVSPARVAEDLAAGRLHAKTPSVDTALTSVDPRLVLHAVLAHAWKEGQSTAMLDVGAHTGLVGLKLARFAQQANRHLRTTLFEPASMSDLCAKNIELNGLSGLVEHDGRAAGTYDGLAIFGLPVGGSDGDRMTDIAPDAVSRIVTVTRLTTVLEETSEDVVLMKLDTEGLEPALLEDTSAARKGRNVVPVFEYMPWRYGEGGAQALLNTLALDHHIIDIGYTPKPWLAIEVPPAGFTAFEQKVRSRPFGYTDILALPKTFPGIDALRARLSYFRQDAYDVSMVSDR